MGRAAVYTDEKCTDELYGFNVLSVNAVRPTRVIGAPVEDGTTSFDNKVIDPVKIIVEGVIVQSSDFGDTAGCINEIESMLENRDFSFYSVSDGNKNYNRLILQEFPSLRDVKEFDFYRIKLVFVKPILIQKGQTKKPRNPENSNSRNTGYSNAIRQAVDPSGVTALSWF